MNLRFFGQAFNGFVAIIVLTEGEITLYRGIKRAVVDGEMAPETIFAVPKVPLKGNVDPSLAHAFELAFEQVVKHLRNLK